MPNTDDQKTGSALAGQEPSNVTNEKVVKLKPNITPSSPDRIADHNLFSWATQHSHEAQRHSITTAAYYAYSIPIFLLFLAALFPITTKFIGTDLKARDYVMSGIGVQVSPGTSPQKRILTISNEYGGDIDSFIIKFEFGKSRFKSIDFKNRSEQFVAVEPVLRDSVSSGAFRSPIRVSNLEAGDSVQVGLTFAESADGFAVNRVLGSNLSIGKSYWQYVTANYNLWWSVAFAFAIFFVYRLYMPYIRHYRIARFMKIQMDDYLEHVSADEAANSPIGKTKDQLFEEFQAQIDRKTPSWLFRWTERDFEKLVAVNRLYTVEQLEDEPGRSMRVMIGPVHIVGYPSFSRNFFMKHKFLITTLDLEQKIVSWTQVTVRQLLEANGTMLILKST